jgi:putative spermidine/putrescine transport system substrate-binding protein
VLKHRCALAAVLVTALAAPAASIGSTHVGAPTLSIVAWHGLLDGGWVKPFEQQSGCKVKATYVGSSNQLVAYMREGKYDLGAASADVAGLLVDAKAVAPIDLRKVPAVKAFLAPFRAPAATTVGTKNYGVAIHWASNLLLYQTKHVQPVPTSWSSIYDRRNRGRITVPNNPMQIADAALYLAKTKPSLGIRDPYELTAPQLSAAVKLLEAQKPLVADYWDYPSDEVQQFQNGHAYVGAGWPWQAATLRAKKVPVADTAPKEGVTGWFDAWMLGSKTKSTTCAYKWLQYASTPAVQAQIAIAYGAAPVAQGACARMDKVEAGSCERLGGNPSQAFLRSIRFWKTPVAKCFGTGGKKCADYAEWQRAWSRIIG